MLGSASHSEANSSGGADVGIGVPSKTQRAWVSPSFASSLLGHFSVL